MTCSTGEQSVQRVRIIDSVQAQTVKQQGWQHSVSFHSYSQLYCKFLAVIFVDQSCPKDLTELMELCADQAEGISLVFCDMIHLNLHLFARCSQN